MVVDLFLQDSFEKHHKKLAAFYKKQFPEEQLLAESRTPRSDATGVVQRVDAACVRIAGEPMHNLFALRKVTRPACNDYHCFLNDHRDMLARLSAPAFDSALDVQPEPFPDLTGAACRLLVAGVTGSSVALWRKALQRQPKEAEELKEMVSHPHASQSPWWRKLFGSQPPRGVLARLARHLQVDLHPTEGFHAYPTQARGSTRCL